MGYSLKATESPPDGLRRIAIEQIDGALFQLQRKDNVNDGIHEARKHFKRLRALVRLGRGGLGRWRYRYENEFYRELGRLLSPVRDAAVLVETFDALAGRYGAQLAGPGFFSLRRSLAAAHTEEMSRLGGDDCSVQFTLQSLRCGRRRAQEWTFDGNGFGDLGIGLGRTYRRGRRERESALRRPSTESFHLWRKRVKYLLYQFQILRPLWPDMMKAMAGACDLVADRLGDEHDLALLFECPPVRLLLEEGGSEGELFRSIVARERERLVRNVEPLSARIYGEKPGPFVDRLDSYRQT